MGSQPVEWDVRELSFDVNGMTAGDGALFAELADDYRPNDRCEPWRPWREEWGAGLRRAMGDPTPFRSSWPDRPFLTTGLDHAAIFDLDTLCRLVDSGVAAPPALRVTRRGKTLDAGSLLADQRLGRQSFTSNADRARIADAVADQGSIALQGLEGLHGPVRDLCVDVAADLGCMVTGTAFYSAPNAAGFAPHYDTHHVLLLQIEGSKRWRVSPPPVTDPLASHTWPDRLARNPELTLVADDERTATYRLTPGGCLWIPRGWVHQGAAGDGGSLHVTLGINPLDDWWLLQRLAEDLGESVRFRGYLPPALEPAPGHAHLDRFRRRLHEAIDQIDLAVVLSRIREYVWFATAEQPARFVRTRMAMAGEPAPNGRRFRVNHRMVRAWRHTADTVELHCGDRIGVVPGRLRVVVDVLRGATELTGADLRTLAGPDAADCADFLVRLGLVEVADDD